jgi:polyphosphate kinase
MQAQMKWNDFTHFKIQMFEHTSTPISPWVVIKGNNKDFARKEAMRYVLNLLPYENKGLTGVRLEPKKDVISVINGLKK